MNLNVGCIPVNFRNPGSQGSQSILLATPLRPDFTLRLIHPIGSRVTLSAVKPSSCHADTLHLPCILLSSVFHPCVFLLWHRGKIHVHVGKWAVLFSRLPSFSLQFSLQFSLWLYSQSLPHYYRETLHPPILGARLRWRSVP